MSPAQHFEPNKYVKERTTVDQMSLNGQNRTDVKVGANVKIVLKADQRTGKLTEGVVARLLTKSSFHPHGIKVQLENGQIGRVQEILPNQSKG